ncbi:MAG: helix-turn-helix transcriptional regulator [Pseudomonadota bacterium]
MHQLTGGLAAPAWPASGVPGEPLLREHIQRMRQLRPGLHLHSDDAHDERDLTAQGEMSAGLRIVLLLEGAVDVSYGQRRVSISSSDAGAGRPLRGAKALMVSVAERDVFMRHTHKGRYARRLSICLGWDWLAQTAGGVAAAAWPSLALQDFQRQHLAMQSWQVSPRAVAIAEQLVRPPQFEPLLQNLYLESRTLELVAEALGSFTSHESGLASPAVQAEPGLRPQEHQRMRDLRAFLATGQADELSLDEIARHAGINANTLQKHFRSLHGSTIFDYLRECRLQRARQALERNGLSVGQAAVLAGYTSAANFATAYKRRFGLTPKLARSRV